LKGAQVGKYSIRINDRLRICFVWREGGGRCSKAQSAKTNFFDNFFPRITISRIMSFEWRNAMETAMAEAGDMAGIGGAAEGGLRPAPQEMARRALRMLERLVAGSTLTEVAAGEGLSPRRARELVAEVVAQRGFDP
jgi:hypothetical protein